MFVTFTLVIGRNKELIYREKLIYNIEIGFECDAGVVVVVVNIYLKGMLFTKADL